MNHKWSERFNQLPAKRREKIQTEVATLLHELPLHELRRARQLSQEQLAKALGEKQSSISKLEQRTDMYVSTLRRYLEAMGGELLIAARFPVGAVEITEFGRLATTYADMAEFAAEHGKASAAKTAGTKSTRNSGKAWNTRAVKELKQLAKENTPTRVIGLKLGRTPGAVQTKASNEGISLKPTDQAPYNRKKK